MQSLRGFGDWLKGGLKLPWGDLAKQTIDVTKATADLSEAWQEAAPKLAKLKDLDRLDSFFKAFDSPVTKLAVAGLPFASVGIELLKLYLDVTKTEPTFESSVVVAAQMAYLESLAGVLERTDKATKAKLETVKLAAVFERQLQKSETVSLTKTRAKKTLTQLRKSELVETLDEALSELLLAAGLADWEVKVLVDQTTWGTPKYFHGVVAELKDKVEPLAEFLRSDGLQIQEKFDSVEDYLKEKIDPLPMQKVFDEETVTFSGLYVPLMVQPLDISGQKMRERPVGIEKWAEELLEQSEPRKIGFIEGDAGRGKSVFCRMFAAMVRMALYPAFIPILIRLRDVRELENNLTQTLETHLQDLDFVQSDSGWLTDENTRFLLIFDGFDELLLQGRESGGLKELVQQIGDFQKNSHHQCLVTGRPLALQGVDRALSQTNNLWRVRLEPMADAQRNEWLSNWAKLFGDAEAQDFQSFLTACPKDIGEQLAREPLLLYLLGRLHRERHLTAQMFSGTEGMRAKVRVYDESIKWVLEQQRQELNEKISGLETEDLRQVLQEAALCVVQSGNETAKLTMLKSRFVNDSNPVAELLKQAQIETEKTEDKALNNLLTAFYLRPGEGDKAGSVEFAHKSFGEFLFAERLKVAFDDWTELDNRRRPRLDDAEVAWQIYDLLGYGPLTIEIVDYFKELLFSAGESDDLVRFFQRLHQFYENWCEGFYIDKAPHENLPQIKLMQMRDVDTPVGLRQVDIYVGLNVMILLFRMHSHAQQQAEESKRLALHFHPCGNLDTGEADFEKLLCTIGCSQLVGFDSFTTAVGPHLSHANLGSANLNNVNLGGANLSGANLSRVYLFRANLGGANLSGADLRRADLRRVNLLLANLHIADLRLADLRFADLRSVNLSGAYLSGANLSSANLRRADLGRADLCSADLHRANLDDIRFDARTNWQGAKGLETAKNIPESLQQQLGLT
ncbi:MAG: pentapeptide repeat-containing protein [Phormidesmis sp.]